MSRLSPAPPLSPLPLAERGEDPDPPHGLQAGGAQAPEHPAGHAPRALGEPGEPHPLAGCREARLPELPRQHPLRLGAQLPLQPAHLQHGLQPAPRGKRPAGHSPRSPRASGGLPPLQLRQRALVLQQEHRFSEWPGPALLRERLLWALPPARRGGYAGAGAGGQAAGEGGRAAAPA